MPTTPTFTGLGLTAAGKLNVNPGAVSLGDPGFLGPLPSTLAPASVPYGVLYNVSSWSGLTDFYVDGATASVVSNQIQLSGGSGGAGASIDRLPYTCLPRWKMTARIQTGATINGSSYGIGIGMRSYNANGYYNALGRVDLSSNATAGKILFGMTAAGGAYADQATSASALAWSAGDYIVLTVARDEDLFVVEVYNDTTHSAVVSLQYRVPFVYPQTYVLPNTGRHAVFTFGGTQLLNSLKIESQALAQADIAIVGDSKSVGYFAGSFNNSFARRLASAFSVVNLSGDGDKTADVLLRIAEIIALKPRTVLLNIGRNDIGLAALAPSVYNANYDNIVSQLTAASIQVVHLLPLYELVATQTPLTSHITGTYTATIDAQLVNWSAASANVLAPDTIHPNGFSHDRIFRAVMSYFGSGDKVYPVSESALSRTRTTGTIALPTGTSPALDWSLLGPGGAFTFILNANATFTFTGMSDGQEIKVLVTNVSTYTVTWPTVQWVGGVAPTQTTGFHTDVYTFKCIGPAGGTQLIYGSAIQNY